MKLLVIACVFAVSHANFLSHVGHVLDHAVDKVGDGVKDAAHTVGDGIDVAAHAVGGAMKDVGHTLDGTFGAVWEVAKDPLEQAGKQILISAGEFALEQGISLALSALAAGKRDTADPQTIKAFLAGELVDEYQKWLKDMETNIKGSKTEMTEALAKATHVNQMPAELKKYLQEYTDAVIVGNTKSFVAKQADQAVKDAITELKTRLEHRLYDSINAITK